MEPRVLVIPSCHLLDANTLCPTARARLDAAIAYANGRSLGDDRFVVTGGEIPYLGEGKTMGGLMREYLIRAGIPKDRVDISGGVGTISEARVSLTLIYLLVPGAPLVILVSSDWHLWASFPVWRYFGRRMYGLSISVLPVRGTGGRRVRVAYFFWAVLIRVATVAGLLPALGSIAMRLESGRRRGIAHRWFDRSFCD